MTLTTYPHLEQRSPEWLAARCGIVTASVVDKLITTAPPEPLAVECAECTASPGDQCIGLRGKPIKTPHPARRELAAAMPPEMTIADNDTSRGIILTLAAERITGHVEQTPLTADMWRGVESEPFAKDAYTQHYAPVKDMGFMVRDFGGFKIGCSPDGLVDPDGGIEIKSPRAKTHLLTVVTDEVPAQHMAQIQTCLLVTGRAWWDFLSFHGGLHLWPKRIYPDPQWHEVILAAAANAERATQELVAKYEAAAQGLPLTDRIPDYAEITV